MDTKIYYRTGFNNQLSDKLVLSHRLLPNECVSTKWITLNNRVLTIQEGYGWDGDSGLIEQNRCTVLASCVHDSLYDLMRRELLCQSHRLDADLLYRELAIAGGLSPFRASIRYHGIRLFGEKYATSAYIKPPLIAP